MSGIMDSLGLDKVEADPNALPDGKWPGEVSRSEYVFVKNKNSVSHVITYRVTAGEHKGAERAEWWLIGTDPVTDDNGKITGVENVTMTSQAKPWYKKRLLDLGVHETEIMTFKPADLVGTEVTFGTKKNDGYININFAEKRVVAVVSEAEQAAKAANLL